MSDIHRQAGVAIALMALAAGPSRKGRPRSVEVRGARDLIEWADGEGRGLNLQPHHVRELARLLAKLPKEATSDA